MAVEKEFEIKVDTKDAVASVNALAGAIDDVGNSTEELKRKAKEAAEAEKKAAKEAADAAKENKEQQSDMFRSLDQLSGGVLQRIADLGKGIKALPAQAKKFGASLSAAFKSGKLGANALKGAIAATGIGALVVALGVIVQNWSSIVDFVTGYNAEADKAAQSATKTREAQEASLSAISESENVLRLQGKSEEEIRKLKEAQTDEVIKATKIEIEALKVKKKEELESYNRQRMFVKGTLQFLTAIPLAIAGAIDGLINALPASVREFIGIGTSDLYGALDRQLNSITTMILGSAEEATAETDEAIAAAEANIRKLENQQAGYELARQKERDDARAKASEQSKKDEEEAEKQRQEAEKRYLDAVAKAAQEEENLRLEMEKQIDEKVYQQQLSARTREEQAVLDKFYALQEYYKDNAEILAQIKEQEQKELQAIDDKYAKEARDKKLAQQAELRDLIVSSASSLFDNLKELNNMYDQNDKAAAEKAFNRNKSLQIAQAIMNTASGIMGQLAVPQDQLTGANFVKAATIAASGATQIAVISKQKFGGGEAQSAAAPSAPQLPSANQPSFNIVGASGINQLQQTIGTALSKPMKAYVVSSEVSTAQAMDRKRIKTATLG